MRIQCSCGFSGTLAGGGMVPSKCPVCKKSSITKPVPTSPCPKCSLQYPLSSSFCPGCGVEKITRQRSKENGSAPKPDNALPPRS